MADRSPSPRPDSSVIVVSWNTRELLRRCLQSLRHYPTIASLETIVIDNGSADGTSAMVRSEFQDIIFIENECNRGFAAAANQGMRLAQGRYVLLLNSDAEVTVGAVDHMVAFADAHLDAGVVGCRIVNPDRTLQCSCMRFPDWTSLMLSATFLSRIFGREDMTWWSHDDERDVDVVKGCAMLVRRVAIEQVGLFDEAFWFYGEETDWCFRMGCHGWRVIFTPGAVVVHEGGGSTARVGNQMALQLWGSKLKFVRKHRSRPYYLACAAAVTLLFGLRIAPCLIVGLVRSGAREAMFERAFVYGSGVVRLVTGGCDSLLTTESRDVAPETAG